MARRKRASMREGPLADLFRSTVREDEEPEDAARELGVVRGLHRRPGADHMSYPDRVSRTGDSDPIDIPCASCRRAGARPARSS